MTTELLNTVYVTSPGTNLHLDADAIRVVHPDSTEVRRLPLQRIDHLVIFRGANVSQDLLLRCAEDGRSVSWLTGAGRFLARVDGPSGGSPLLRMAQWEAQRSPEVVLDLGRRFVAGKLQNARQVLLRAARDRTGTLQSSLREAAEQHATAITSLPTASNLDAVRGFEGRAARSYFEAFAPATGRGGVRMSARRIRRPATDPVNALFSFLYGMLRVRTHGALEAVGLDPHIGYLHGVRPGKPALALDLMEEFRPVLVDRLVMTMVNRGEVRVNHFQTWESGAVELTDHGRRCVLDAWQRAGVAEVRHPAMQSEVPVALLPLIQARLLARTLRGDLPSYEPWMLT